MSNQVSNFIWEFNAFYQYDRDKTFLKDLKSHFLHAKYQRQVENNIKDSLLDSIFNRYYPYGEIPSFKSLDLAYHLGNNILYNNNDEKKLETLIKIIHSCIHNDLIIPCLQIQLFTKRDKELSELLLWFKLYLQSQADLLVKTGQKPETEINNNNIPEKKLTTFGKIIHSLSNFFDFIVKTFKSLIESCKQTLNNYMYHSPIIGDKIKKITKDKIKDQSIYLDENSLPRQVEMWKKHILTNQLYIDMTGSELIEETYILQTQQILDDVQFDNQVVVEYQRKNKSYTKNVSKIIDKEGKQKSYTFGDLPEDLRIYILKFNYMNADKLYATLKEFHRGEFKQIAKQSSDLWFGAKFVNKYLREQAEKHFTNKHKQLITL